MQSTTLDNDHLLNWLTELSDQPVSPELEDTGTISLSELSSWNDEITAGLDAADDTGVDTEPDPAAGYRTLALDTAQLAESIAAALPAEAPRAGGRHAAGE